jgi:hypothetical protein
MDSLKSIVNNLKSGVKTPEQLHIYPMKRKFVGEGVRPSPTEAGISDGQVFFRVKHTAKRFPFSTFYFLLLSIFLAACGAQSPTPISLVPSVMPKLLATVYISPTPDAQQMEATRLASPPTTTPQPNFVPTATVYVGVFLGEADVASGGGPVINPVLSDSAPTAVGAGDATPACPAQADVIFGTTWEGDATASGSLGCPIELASSINGTAQVFERGVMYARPNGEIWAIVPGTNRYWYYPVTLPPSPDAAPAPPAGLLPPSDTFSTIWRSVQGLSDALGFARTGDQTSSITTQRFQGGALLADGSSGQVFVLLADGRAFGPY